MALLTLEEDGSATVAAVALVGTFTEMGFFFLAFFLSDTGDPCTGDEGLLLHLSCLAARRSAWAEPPEPILSGVRLRTLSLSDES